MFRIKIYALLKEKIKVIYIIEAFKISYIFSNEIEYKTRAIVED